nr:hypothetical protein Iba_chr13bCG9050 [Ipomoea batatas]
MPRVVIYSPSCSDSTEVEESSDFEAYSPPADESSTVFGGFVNQLFADPSGFPSHLPASPSPDSPSLSPLARGPGEFEDVEFFPTQLSILKESDVSLVRLILGPSAELSPNSFRFVTTFLSLCDSLSIRADPFSFQRSFFYVAAVGSRSPGSIQIVLREGLRFEGISKSFKRFVFVRPVGSAFDFPTSWPSYYFKLDRPPAPNRGVSPASSGFSRPRSGAGDCLYRTGSFRECWACYLRELRILVPPPLLVLLVPYRLGWLLDMTSCRSGFAVSPRSHTARSAAPPPPSTEGPGDKGKNPVDEPFAPPTFSSSPPCALADSGALRKRARAEPAEEEPSGSLPQPLTLTVTGWTDSSMSICRLLARRLSPTDDCPPLSAIAAVSANRKYSQARSQELEELDARFKDLTMRVSRSGGGFSSQPDYSGGASASLSGGRGGTIGFASPGGAEYAAEMSLEDYYEGLGVFASGAHPPGFAFPSDSGGRREIPFDSAYLNSAANLQVLADLSNAEVSLGPLDSFRWCRSSGCTRDV